MSKLKFEYVDTGTLYLHASFDTGLHCVTAGEGASRDEFVQLAAGLVQPPRGTVNVQGQAPFSTPQLRARIGSLLGTERLIARGEVSEALRTLLGAGTGAESGQIALDRVGAGALLQRRVASMTADEHRALALALALNTRNPALLVLNSPLDIQSIDRSRVAALLHASARECSVVILTSDASNLPSARQHVLQQGRLQSAAAADTQQVTIRVLVNGALTVGEALAAVRPSWGVTASDGELWLTCVGEDWLAELLAATQRLGVKILSVHSLSHDQRMKPPLGGVRLSANADASSGSGTAPSESAEPSAYRGRIEPSSPAAPGDKPVLGEQKP